MINLEWYKEITKELFYRDTILIPVRSFFERCLKRVPPVANLIGEREDKIRQILTTLLNLVGTEIEGREISFGVIIADSKESVCCRDAAINDSLNEYESFGSYGFETIRKIVRYMHRRLLGWTPGYYEQPIIICDINSLSVSGLKILTTITSDSHTPHEAYKKLTQNRKCIGIWVKPAGSVRIYGEGRFIGQMMRLRDAGGWAIRNVNDIYEYVKFRSEGPMLASNMDLTIDYFIYPAIAMSEERKGASIYVVPKDKWNDDEGKIVAGFPHKFTTPINITSIKETEFMVYLQQDGCIVLSQEGHLLAVGNYFKGPGGRKRIADYVCKLWGAQAIVVSQDGPIRFYSHLIEDETHAEEEDIDEKDKKYKYLRLDFIKLSTI